MSDDPQADAAAPVPEILVFGMSGGFVGATINRSVNPAAASLGAQHQTQLVIAPTQDALNVRCIATLIQEFGLAQADAEALVASGMQPMVPAGGAITDAPSDGSTYGRLNAAWAQALPMAGGNLTGGLGVAAPGVSFPGMGSMNANHQLAWQANRIWPYVNLVAQGPIAYTTDIPAASALQPSMDGSATPGASAAWSRGDHVHPTDTSRYAATNPSGYQTAAQVTAALAPYAPLASPAFTGSPVAPTPAASNASSVLATTAFVRNGTATNDSAAAGQVGEWISNAVQSGAGVALTTDVAFNVTSISLTPGDWDVQGQVVASAAAATHVTAISAWTNTVSAAPPATLQGGYHGMNGLNPAPGQSQTLPTGRMRFSLATTTTIWLSGVASFSWGTCTGLGFISARRMR